MAQTPFTGPAKGMASSRIVIVTSDWRAISLRVVATPPPGWVAQDMNIRAALGDDVGHQPVERGTVADDVGQELKPLPLRHDGNAVVPHGAIDDDPVAGAGTGAGDGEVVLHQSDARRIDEDPVGLAPGDDLGVAGDDPYPGGIGSLAHGRKDGPEVVPAESLLDDEAGTQEQGTRAHHGQVIDGPVDRQGSDIAAREKDGVDNVGIGGECQPAAVGIHQGRVVLTRQGYPRQSGDDEVVQELVG